MATDYDGDQNPFQSSPVDQGSFGQTPVDSGQPPAYPSPQLPPESPFEGNPYVQSQYSNFEQPDRSESALKVSIVSLIFGVAACGLGFLGSPFGMAMGHRELKAMDAGLSNPANRPRAKMAFVAGLIGTVILAVGVLAVLAFVLSAVL